MLEGHLLGIVGIFVLVVAMMLWKVPPGFAMGICGLVGILFQKAATIGWGRGFESAMSLSATEMWTTFSKSDFAVIPMFILVGELIYYAGYSDALFNAAYAWFGRLPGGLAITSILACAGFSSICGSNSATAATMSAVAMPQMKRRGYDPALSSGAVAAGSTLGVMIPPSIVLVVYGLSVGESIGKLFFGVLVPGLLLAGVMALIVLGICLKNPAKGPAGESVPLGQRLKGLLGIIDIVVLFIAIMALLLTGKVTATEAGAASAFLAFVLCLVRRKLTWAKFKGAMHDTLRISCMVFMIVAGAMIFGRFMTITRLPFEAAEYITGMQLSPWWVLVILLIVFTIAGCLMDALAFLLIALPIVRPLLLDNGAFDPVWLGVVLCLITTLGAITPPVGICAFIVASMNKDIPMHTVFRGALYFLPAYVGVTGLLIAFPSLATWLASFVR